MSETSDKLITDREVAGTFGIARSTVWAWADKGLIPKPVVSRHKFARWSNNQVQAAVAALRKNEIQEAAS